MLKEIVTAFQSYAMAHRFIKEHKLWTWILIPGILYMLLFMVSMYYFGETASYVVNHLIDSTGLHTWIAELNQAWVSFLFLFLFSSLWVLLMLFYFSLFKYIFLIIGAPLFAYLSEKTESIMEGKAYPFVFKQFLQDILRGISLAIRNSLWQTVYTIAIILLAFIPLVGWAAPVLSLFIECYYFGFAMLDHSCERHKLSSAQSIHFIARHKGLAIGNGFVFYIMHLVPIVGWVLAPSYAIIAATISLNKTSLRNRG